MPVLHLVLLPLVVSLSWLFSILGGETDDGGFFHTLVASVRQRGLRVYVSGGVCGEGCRFVC